jgi:predicted amidohydrolase YtcJ
MKMYTYNVGGIFAVAGLLLGGCTFQSEPADLILHNAVVLTMTGVGEDVGVEQAVAIRDGLVVGVGKEREILNKFRTPRKLDLRGHVVMPGLIDAHAHLLGYAEGLTQVDLVGTSSWDEVVSRVAAFGQTSNLPFLTGRGWDQNDWSTPDWPTRAALDSLFPDRPVFLTRIDGHAGIANGAALQAAGITSASFFDGGEVVLDASGAPTGVLIDAAMAPLEAAIPPLDDATRRAALQEAESNLFASGITAVVDAGLGVGDLAFLEDAYAAEELRIRLWAWAADTPESHAHWLERGPIRQDRFTVEGFKFYLDGALGSRGAVLLAPYSDRPEWSGLQLESDLDALRGRFEALRDAGFQVATHAIGDSANRVALQLYEQVLGGMNDRRWRIEHAQVVAKTDIPRFAANGIIPSVQPTHATSDMYWAGMRLGRNRLARAYAYKDLQGALGLLALGTDFPVEDIDPRKTFYAAVARRDAQGEPKAGFQIDQALKPADALRGMTVWAALASFQSDSLGTIEPGKWADLTVVDRNWLTVEPSEVLRSEVVATVVAGDLVYQDARMLK